MNAKRPRLPLFLLLALLAPGLLPPPPCAAVCDDQPDAPDCACFDDTGVWDAGGAYPLQPIQVTAAQTVGTREACNCESEIYCSPVIKNSGKPYYQMVLGMNTETAALFASYVLSTVGADALHHRVEWCSETISYWHREAGLPYFRGYRNDWFLDWQNYNVADMREWYTTEQGAGGRGRWLPATEVAYWGAELGVDVPVPGAYVATRGYDPGVPPSWTGLDYSHSLLVDEMWVHRDKLGSIFQIEISLLEGNSSRSVRDDHHWDDVLSLTPQGGQWVGWNRGPDGASGTADDVGMKIYGFGIDLDAAGQPVYDAGRLHEISHDFISTASVAPLYVEDLDWETHYPHVPDLIAFAKPLLLAGGPTVWCSEQGLDLNGIPDGGGDPWVFPDTLKEDVVVRLDFLAGNPLAVRGAELTWNGELLPSGYQVRFGNAQGAYTSGDVTDMSQIEIPDSKPAVPVRVKLDPPKTGIRYLEMRFPAGTFPADGTLEELRVLYERGAWADLADPPDEIPVFVDLAPGSCPNRLSAGSQGTVSVAVLGTELLDVTTLDTATIRWNGAEIAASGTEVRDAAVPAIGDASACPPRGGDGYPDLVLTYPAASIVSTLDPAPRPGETYTLRLTAALTQAAGGTQVRGQDTVKLVAGSLPAVLLLTLEE